MNDSSSREHAVVIGGGIGGLVCARVLCKYFSKVTIVEKDLFPKTPEIRKGVPQGHYLHILLAKGLKILDELFPEFLSTLEADGAVKINVGTDMVAILPQGCMPKYESDIWLYGCSRPFLEWHIYKQLSTIRKINFIQQCKVSSLLYDHDKKSVTGVSLQQKDGQKELLADIVVDAGGRASKAGEWLENLGFEKPEETIIQAPVVYNCRMYKKPANFQADWKMLSIYPGDAENSCGGFVYPIENDRWMVTLAGVGKTPSTEESLFLEFARNLPVPDIYNAIKDAEPLSPIYSRRRTVNRIRHFEKLNNRPECFFTLGDSVCTYNPVYGQGMVSAILGAVTFDELLSSCSQDLTNLAERFQKKLAEVNFTIWQRGSLDDLRWSETSYENEKLQKEIMERTKYMDRLWELAIHDTKIAELLWNVLHVLKPASALMTLEVQNKLAKFKKPKTHSNVWHARVKPNGGAANIFDADEDLKKIIGQWVAKKEFKKLAQLWVQGGSIDWQSLYEEKTPQRLHLPTHENQIEKKQTEKKILKSQAVLTSKKKSDHSLTHSQFLQNESDSQKESLADQTSMGSEFQELILINQTSHGRPVFWIHGGVGGVYPYYSIAENLQRPFYGIQSKGHRPASCRGIEAIASYYIRIMQSIQPEGPYDLGGYSLGGLICYEITRQLQESGETVSSIIMLDTLDTSGLKKLRTSRKSWLLMAVNWTLAARAIQKPQQLAETLIHRSEINCSLKQDRFKKRLIDLATKRGLATEAQLNEKIEQMSNDEREFEAGRYSLLPLSFPKSVQCYYFRNKSGLFFGELEPYFSISSDENLVDHTNYWELWQKHLPNFEIMDVDSPNHMDLLLDPKVNEAITDFCSALYSEDGMTAKFLESFKHNLKNKHGVLNLKNLESSKSSFISRLLSNITRAREKMGVNPF